MAKAKSRAKSRPANAIPANGGYLIPGKGRGPKKGAPNAGRPPDAFKAMCQGLASSADVEKAVRRVVKNPRHPAFIGALKWASEHGYGRPEQAVDLTSKGEKLPGVILMPPEIPDQP